MTLEKMKVSYIVQVIKLCQANFCDLKMKTEIHREHLSFSIIKVVVTTNYNVTKKSRSHKAIIYVNLSITLLSVITLCSVMLKVIYVRFDIY